MHPFGSKCALFWQQEALQHFVFLYSTIDAKVLAACANEPMLRLVSTAVCLLSHCHSATTTQSDHTVANVEQENNTERGRCDVALHCGCQGGAGGTQQDLRG